MKISPEPKNPKTKTQQQNLKNPNKSVATEDT